jgi:hypothetical protein
MAVADVQARIEQLVAVIDEVTAAPTVKIWPLEKLIDHARWVKLYVDLELAFKPHRYVEDELWLRRSFTTEDDARQLLVEFRATVSDMAAATSGLVALRNLRARIEGLLHVTQDWWRWKAESKSKAPPSSAHG